MNDDHDEFLARARRLHDRAVVIDTHCDTTQRLMDLKWDFARRHDDGHVDLPRLREGGIDAVFLAVFTPGPLEPGEGVAAVRRQIPRIQETIAQHAGQVVAARTADDIRRAVDQGKIALLIAIEGGYLIEDSLDTLREYHQLGATYLTLTHAFHTNWADSSGVHESLPAKHAGLTDFGRRVIRELNRLGMMVDVSHVHDLTFWDVIETSAAPVIATHSSCRAVSPHRRNLTDEMLRAIAATGGTVQMNFGAYFLDSEFPQPDPEEAKAFLAAGSKANQPPIDHVTPFEILVDHVDHALQVIGPEHVGIGSDFDGVRAVPAGMEDCSKLVNLTAALLGRGYSEADLAKVLGGNVLRAMDACREVADRGQALGPRRSVRSPDRDSS